MEVYQSINPRKQQASVICQVHIGIHVQHANTKSVTLPSGHSASLSPLFLAHLDGETPPWQVLASFHSFVARRVSPQRWLRLLSISPCGFQVQSVCQSKPNTTQATSQPNSKTAVPAVAHHQAQQQQAPRRLPRRYLPVSSQKMTRDSSWPPTPLRQES